jgi:hypothetical protein
MSISTATDRFPSHGRLLRGRVLVVSLLAAIALAAAIVAIALSSSTTSRGGFAARPGVIHATGSPPASARGTFRDPVTHAVPSTSPTGRAAVNGSVVPHETPGPGYR